MPISPEGMGRTPQEDQGKQPEGLSSGGQRKGSPTVSELYTDPVKLDEALRKAEGLVADFSIEGLQEYLQGRGPSLEVMRTKLQAAAEAWESGEQSGDQRLDRLVELWEQGKDAEANALFKEIFPGVTGNKGTK